MAALFTFLVVAVIGGVLFFTVGGNSDEPTGPGSGADAATAADAGTGAVVDPLAKARSGLQQAALPLSLLSGGVDQLVDGGHQLDDGAKQLSDGLGQARGGASELSGGLEQLNGGVDLLGAGAQQISGGVDEVVDRLAGFGEMQGQVTGSLRQVVSTLSASNDPVSQAAAARVSDLVVQLETQGLGPDTLGQLAELKSGARQLSFEMNDPSAQFVSGVAQVADGSRQLSDGLALLDDGGRALVDGTGQLVAGTGPITGVVKSLSTSVGDASKALPAAGRAAIEPAADAAPPVVGQAPNWPYVVAALAVLLAAASARIFYVLGRRGTTLAGRKNTDQGPI